MRRFLEQAGLPLLRCLDPERAHGLALKALRAGLAPQSGPITSSRLAVQFAGLDLPNPLGLAAGFDKNAEAVAPLLQAGFGFIEVGAATPRPQPGNPRPRLFRLGEDRAAINRFGFNNEGMDRIAGRLAARSDSGIVGLNLGANKDSDDRAGDFAKVLKTTAPHIDFATVNVSSPNTEKLRDLQGKAALSALLEGVNAANVTGVPIFLKIAPDLSETDLDDIAEVAVEQRISAIITTNTTLSRTGLESHHAGEAGGLSGQPLFDLSTRVLARLYLRLEGRIPLIGVGGIASAEQAMAKIRAGASALQLYTALVYEGLSLVPRILGEMDNQLARDDVTSISELVGSDAPVWAEADG